MNKICVIGSNSFSGSHFVNESLERGFDVLGISRSDELNQVFLPYKWSSSKERGFFSFFQGDININLDEIMNEIIHFCPDYIVNFSAQSMVAQSWENPAHWFQTNAVGTVNLHDEIRKLDFLKKYVHISTPEVYGNCQGLVKESTLYTPSTPYAVSRAAADMSLMSFYQAYDFPVVFTRAANVYGPGQQLYRIIPRAILFFLTNKTLQLHGGGESLRSFIHIKDVCDGTLKIMQHASAPEIFHLSTAENISVRSLVENIAQQLGVNFDDHVEVTGERLGKDQAYLLDSSKAIEQLDWQVKTTLEQGIDETIGWVKNNLEQLLAQPLNYLHKK